MCNGLYRDFKPDYLVSGDAGVIKEICAKGYPKENKCIFPDWSPVPRDFIDMIVEPMRNDGYSVEEQILITINMYRYSVMNTKVLNKFM